MRHLFETTTANLVTSSDASKAGTLTVALPTSFFLNNDVLFDVLAVDPPGDFQGMKVTRLIYQSNLDKYAFKLLSGKFQQLGDTFFGYLVPEASFEDINALEHLIAKRLITQKFAACVMMIDFPNPVFSPIRQVLSKYVPTAGAVQADLSAPIIAAIMQAAAALPVESAEGQFVANWKLPDDQWKNVFAGRIRDYLAAANTKLTAKRDFDAYVELAESRRRQFATLPLDEFDLLLPVTSIPHGPSLRMNADGSVGPR